MKDNINPNNLPRHIAIIMDGNGRWARQHGQERIYGHQHGVESVRSVIEGCGEIGIKYLTLYAFSTENWNRPKEEVDALMTLLVKSIHNELEGLMKNRVRLQAIGNLQSLPAECQQELQAAIDATAPNNGLTTVLALSYSARWELTEMARKAALLASGRQLQPENITAETVASLLATANMPDPDILIRTGGECRVSNFLLWQIAYTELFFPNLMWPDFRKENLWQIILDYQSRERRFGKIGEHAPQ
ncbi:MAG: isoprenyl transferase [Bacteroidales bacterium]|nr:isoprenyl transferase [Bacteroidales bacterium]